MRHTPIDNNRTVSSNDQDLLQHTAVSCLIITCLSGKCKVIPKSMQQGHMDYKRGNNRGFAWLLSFRIVECGLSHDCRLLSVNSQLFCNHSDFKLCSLDLQVFTKSVKTGKIV